MSKLRLDYFLSLGLKLVDGDEVNHVVRIKLCSSSQAESYNSARDYDCSIHITSFAPRKNEGVQPCGDDVPVVVEYVGCGVHEGLGASHHGWSIDNTGEDIINWKPDLGALIKMQTEHDAKQVKQAKPRTKVEYVKVDKNADGGSFWECARDFASGVDFYTDGIVDLLVSNNDYLLANYKSGLLYRKVETEITWQDEARSLCHNLILNEELVGLTPVSHAEFIEMCRVVIAAVDGK